MFVVVVVLPSSPPGIKVSSSFIVEKIVFVKHRRNLLLLLLLLKREKNKKQLLQRVCQFLRLILRKFFERGVASHRQTNKKKISSKILKRLDVLLCICLDA